MVEEIGAACRASMGLAFEASLDPKPRGGHEGCLGDTTCGPIRVADLGGRILKWAKTDEEL